MSTAARLPLLSGTEGWVLAGGRGTRMGRDKARATLWGRPLIEIAIGKLHAVALPAGSGPRIAGSRQDLSSYAPVVDDLHPGAGPLSGIEAALASAREPLNLFIPIDLPLLPAGFLSWMVARAAQTGALATFPRLCGLDQPLCAIYHRDLGGAIGQLLHSGERRVSGAVRAAIDERCRMSKMDSPRQFLDIFDLELVAASIPEMHSFSPLPMRSWFDNCNSPLDLADIERRIGMRDTLT